jgi:hypothetical protein
MATQSNSPSGNMKIEQARRLMEQGHYRESLLLALETLLQELTKLRESLIAIQMLTRLEMEPVSPARPEPRPSEPDWLPIPKPRVIH